MDNKEDKELIKRMAEILRNHTAPYKEGAWERFAASSVKQHATPVKWSYWAAAAVLLISAGLFMFDWRDDKDMLVGTNAVVLQQEDNQAPISQPIQEIQEAVIEEIHPAQQSETVAIPYVQAEKANKPVTVKVSGTQSLLANHESIDEHQLTVSQSVDTTSRSLLAYLPTKEAIPLQATEVLAAQETEVPASGMTDEERSAALMDKLLEEGGQTTSEYAHANNKDTHVDKRWDLGIMVSPTVTSERLNMGGGLAVAYHLSDKFSLSSGISISDMGVANQPGGRLANGRETPQHSPVEGPNNLTSEFAPLEKRVTDVTSALLTMDVPLDLRYNISGRFYASAGVSFLAILNENRTNHYLAGINQPTFAEKNAGNQDLASSTRATYSTERSAQQPLDGRGYAGFVNFSVGHKIPLSRKLSISVEPFFKLPVGRLSQEDMDLTNGGIRIITGF